MGLALFCLCSSISLGNPEGGVVVGGQAAISQAGTTLQVLQSSDRAVINWRDFSIQPNETTRFIQPSASSAVLNRVTSSSPSQLLGSLQANGQVYLMNQNGIFVGQGAVINASSFLATTAEANPSSFMRGEALSMVTASDAGIRNEGTIQAEGGSIHLLAKRVENVGKLEATEGTVGLYAGNRFYLEQDTGGPIRVRIDMDPSSSDSRAGIGIDQQGIIRAARVNLEANGNIYALAIQQNGLVEATGFVTKQDGTVVLSAPGGKILQSGTMLAKNSDGSGGQMELRGAEVELDLGSILTASGSGVGSGGGAITIDSEGTSLVQGQLDVSSVSAQGGRLVVTGQRVGFLEGTISASGGSGGGEVLLGGDYQGKNLEVKNAQATFMGKDAVIAADATGSGDGGKIILWSDEYTGFYGELFARGGAQGGNGGFIETSSKNNLQAFGSANASALVGKAGLWLLDPQNVSIINGGAGNLTDGVFDPSTPDAAIAPTTIVAALDGGTSVTITTGSTGSQDGNITVTDAVSTAASADTSLTLSAANNIVVNNVINLSSNSGEANVLFLADADASGGGTVTLNAAVTSGTTGTVTLQGASRIEVGATLTARNVIFRQSTTGTTMGVADPLGTVQVALSDLQNLSANGTVTLGRSDITGTIRIGGTTALDLSGESYGLDVLTASGGQTRLNGNITTAGKTITFNSAVIITGDRTLKTDQGVANGAAITMNRALDSDGLSGGTGAFWDLTLEAGTGGDVTFAQAVGVGARLGNITIGPANNLIIQGALRAESLATASLVLLGGKVTLDGSLDFSNHGIASTTVGLNLVAVGKITLNAGADVTSGGAVTLQGTGGIETGADFLAVDSSITFRSAVTLTGPVALTVQGATAGGGLPPEIRFENTVETASSSLSANLTLDAGSFGDVVFVGGAGQSNPLGTVQVVSANNLTVAAMQANSFQQSAGYGQTTFNGPQNYSAVNASNLGLGVTTLGNIAVAAASITTGNGGTVTLDAGQRIDIGSGGDISADGVVTLTAGSGITTGGDILTSGDMVQFKSAVLLASDLTVDTRDSSAVGNVTFSSTVDGPYGLEIFAGQVVDKVAEVTFTGSVGAINSLADLDVKAESIQLNGSTYRIDGLNPELNPTATFDGSVILGADAVFDLDGVAADNSLSFLGTLNSDSTARSLTINTGTGVLRFDGTAGFQVLGPALNNVVISSGPLASTGVVQMKGASFLFGSALGVRVTDSGVGLLVNSSGLVSFPTAIGADGTPLASLSIQGSSMVFGGSNIRTVGNVSISTGIITTPVLEGPGGGLNLTATTGDITVTGLIDTRGKTGESQQDGGDVTITTAGNISVADVNTSAGTGKDAGLISMDSGNSKTITLNGTLTATGGRNGSAIVFNDDVSLGGATSILTSGGTGTSGAITFAETIGGAQSLTLNSGSADITFSGAVAVTGAGTVALTADTINLNATLSSVSGNITLQPFTPGLGMSISDSSAVGLVLTKAEVAQITTGGQVTFGSTAAGTIELAGTAGTAFGYNTVFVSGVGLNLNGDVDGGSTLLTLNIPNLNVTTDATLRAGSLAWSGTTMNGASRALTFNVPRIELNATTGSDIRLNPNLIFAQNTTWSADGRNPIFLGSIGSSTGAEKLVVTSGATGNLSFLDSVGQGARVFGDLLVQGNRVRVASGVSLRAGRVTVDAGAFDNQAGSGALVSTSGRTVLFSRNPNNNFPTSYNVGLAGLNPVFNQPAQIQIGSAPGTYTVGGSLPNGSLALYSAQLADVLPVADLFQITDQLAYLAAVPITGITLPRLFVGEVAINRSQVGGVAELQTMNTPKYQSNSRLGIKGDKGKPVTRLPSLLNSRKGEPTGLREVSQKIGGEKGELSYSQYSQGFDSLGQ
jgi:filamentous hemagglutinin family protein